MILQNYLANNAFLNGQLTKEVYISQPQGLHDLDFSNHVCRLQKAIYGLKEAIKPWYQELHDFLLYLGLTVSREDTSLFIYSQGDTLIYFLVYVDDLIITCNDDLVVTHIITRLDSTFSTKDLGVLSFFCGIEVIRDTNGLFLTQQKYIYCQSSYQAQYALFKASFHSLSYGYFFDYSLWCFSCICYYVSSGSWMSSM